MILNDTFVHLHFIFLLRFLLFRLLAEFICLLIGRVDVILYLLLTIVFVIFL